LGIISSFQLLHISHHFNSGLCLRILCLKVDNESNCNDDQDSKNYSNDGCGCWITRWTWSCQRNSYRAIGWLLRSSLLALSLFILLRLCLLLRVTIIFLNNGLFCLLSWRLQVWYHEFGVLFIKFANDSVIASWCNVIRRLLCNDILEQFVMSFFNWHHSCNNIPIYRLSAWWRCYRSWVNESVAGVEIVNQLSVVNLCNDRILVCISERRLDKFVPVHAIEESINDINLLRCYTFVVVFGIENYSKCGSNKSSFDLRRIMNCVHFKIESLAINCVLGFSMEMELYWLEFIVCSKGFLCIFGGEVWLGRVHLNRCIRSFICYFRILDILIILHVFISFNFIKFGVRKINWTLVFSPTKILCTSTQIEAWPIGTICLVVPSVFISGFNAFCDVSKS